MSTVCLCTWDDVQLDVCVNNDLGQKYELSLTPHCLEPHIDMLHSLSIQNAHTLPSRIVCGASVEKQTTFINDNYRAPPRR